MCHYEYDAYGNHVVLDSNNTIVTSDTFIGNINSFRYKGYYFDSETSLYYCMSRYYNPEWCRWISPDNLRYLAFDYIEGLNLYCYCLNNPIMYRDSCGYYPEWPTFSNLFDGTSTALQLVLNGAYIGSYFRVVNAIRPNNIGVGIWNKQQTAAIKSFKNDADALGKFGTIMTVITVAIQVGEGAFNDYNRGYSLDRIISNAVVDIIVYSTTSVLLTKLGGFVGSFIPIPIVGSAIGTAAGYFAGLGVDWVLELDINGKLIIDHIKDFVYDSWKSFFD